MLRWGGWVWAVKAVAEPPHSKGDRDEPEEGYGGGWGICGVDDGSADCGYGAGGCGVDGYFGGAAGGGKVWNGRERGAFAARIVCYPDINCVSGVVCLRREWT